MSERPQGPERDDLQDDQDQEDPQDMFWMEELRKVTIRMDPVPASVVSAARAAFTWRRIDAELAELEYDSILDKDRLVTVRSSETPRLLTFQTCGGITVDLEVTFDDDERRLVGQLIPAERASLEIRHKGGTISVQTDDRGRFAVGGVTAGLLSLACCLESKPESPPVHTEWTLI